MSLSVCMIVRNEGQRLAKALTSVRAVADEIIITDTGSTDDTLAIAQSFGAKVNHFTWCDDFAAARNACATHATKDWILWLDGDERLKPGTEHHLRAEIASPRHLAYQLIREENFFADRPGYTSEMYCLRLVRRDLPCTFVGRIHEHLDPWPIDLALRTGMLVTRSHTRLEHWGYTNDRIPEKCRRAAHLCDLELQARPGQLYYLVELARALLSIPTPESHARALTVLAEASALMLKHRDDLRAPSPLASSLIEQLLALPHQAFIPVDELLRLAHRWFPAHAPLVWAVARIQFDRAHWPAAEATLRRLLNMLAAGAHDHIAPFDPRITEDAQFNLAVCLTRQAKLPEAETAFTALLTSPRRADDARANLAIIKKIRADHNI